MANILTYLWSLLTDLPGALRPRSSARTTSGTARENCARPARAAAQGPAPDPAAPDLAASDLQAIEQALAQLTSLFAQWQAGTLPPQTRYFPHPSWHPVWRRNRAPAAPPPPSPRPAPRPSRPHTAPGEAAPRANGAAPAHPLPLASRPPALRSASGSHSPRRPAAPIAPGCQATATTPVAAPLAFITPRIPGRAKVRSRPATMSLRYRIIL